MAYTFVEGRFQKWSWRGILATFCDEELLVVLGDGLVKICLMPSPGSYDHSRHHAARLGEGPALTGQAPIWDFYVTQVNGTQVRFHPQLTKRRIKLAGIDAPPPTEGPPTGLGQSMGPGTYRGFMNASHAGVGDATPTPAMAGDSNRSGTNDAIHAQGNINASDAGVGDATPTPAIAGSGSGSGPASGSGSGPTPTPAIAGSGSGSGPASGSGSDPTPTPATGLLPRPEHPPGPRPTRDPPDPTHDATQNWWELDPPPREWYQDKWNRWWYLHPSGKWYVLE